MARILMVQPGAGAPGLLTLEAWRALSGAPVFAAPDDELGARLRDEGFTVTDLDEATAPAPDAEPLRGRNLLGHQHGDVGEHARAVADRLGDLAAEHGQIAFISHGEDVTRAVMERALRDGLEVEFVIGQPARGHMLLDLVKVMARLRGPGGCPWDAEQTHQTLAKHLLDETYEVLEAIDAGDDTHLAEELGDLLLQVVFHAQMGADAGTFDIDDVASGLTQKLVRRHPHVFGDVEVSGAREVVTNWDAIKNEEKQRESATDGVPDALPALALAQKLQRRAGAAGFDWPDVDGVLAKVREEAQELADARDDDAREHELGDLLFAMVALARHLDVDAETALRRAARRFRERLRHVERMATEHGTTMDTMSAEQLQTFWDEAKRAT